MKFDEVLQSIMWGSYKCYVMMLEKLVRLGEVLWSNYGCVRLIKTLCDYMWNFGAEVLCEVKFYVRWSFMFDRNLGEVMCYKFSEI